MLLSSLLMAIPVIAVTYNASCYYPDGSLATTDTPCGDPDRAPTHCCNAQSALCMSLGYCLAVEQRPYLVSRGSCTDRSWSSSGCPRQCSGVRHNPSGGMPLSWFGSSDSLGESLYCCGALTVNDDGNATACADGTDPFPLANTNALLYGVAMLANLTEVSETSSTTSATSTTSITSITSDTTTGLIVTTTTTVVCSSSASKTTAVGAGVGAPLGALAIAAVVWAAWERRKRARMAAALLVAAGDTKQAAMTVGVTSGPTGAGALQHQQEQRYYDPPTPYKSATEAPIELAASHREELPGNH